MATFKEDFTGENLKRLRKAGQLTQEELGSFLAISGKTVQNVEKNIVASVNANIDSFEDFFGYSEDELRGGLIIIPDNFREILQARHAENEEYYVKLTKNPTVAFALKLMISEGKLDTPMTIQDIRDYLAEKGWHWADSTLPDSINQNKDKLNIIIGKIPDSDKGYHYWVERNVK